MNEMMIFSNSEFGKIRAVEVNGEPWLVGKDVAAALGYSAERNAIAAHVDEEDKLTHQISASGQMRSVTLINESGLYSLVLSSKLPGAKRFKRWVLDNITSKGEKEEVGIRPINYQISSYTADLQIFENKKFGNIRTMTENGKILFCGKDVAKALGYKRPNDAITAHCRGTVKRRIGVETGTRTDGTAATQQVEMLFITEGDIYRLAAKSELPGADEFERWIFDEVLPSIRKHGGYIAGQESMSDEELLARALMVAQSRIEERDRMIAEMQAKAELDAPKVAFADAVHNSNGNITVEKYAKLLHDEHGLRIGRNKMFSALRDMGYLRQNNMPYQRYLESGYFETCEVIKNGRPFVVTLITGKGQTKLYKKFAEMLHAS